MSSELKLSGDAAGRVILQGNDTITADQTFTFPDTGGEVATKAAGTPPAVGYQQGTWTAELNGSATGVTNVQSNTSWTRIGNVVTVWFSLGVGNKTTSGNITIKGLPYRCSDTTLPQGFIGDRGPVTYGPGYDDMHVRVNLNASELQLMQHKGDQHGDFSNGSLPANFSFRGTCAYITDNTDWTPINGATVS